MEHAFVTVIAPVAAEHLEETRRRALALGNPAEGPLREALDAANCIHFCSVNVFDASAGDGGHLVFEFSGDGDRDELFAKLAWKDGPGGWLGPVFDLTRDRGTATLDAYWRTHVVEVGHGLVSNPGLAFCGTPTLSVDRIRREAALIERLAELLEGPASDPSALGRLDAIREALKSDQRFEWAMSYEPVLPTRPKHTFPGGLPGAIGAFTGIFLPPVFVLAFLVFLLALSDGFVEALLWGFGTAAVVSATALAFVYVRLRKAEAREVPPDQAADPARVAAIVDRENHAAQNHLAALSVMKAGLLRKLTLRAAFLLITVFATRWYKPGWLGPLGTIHFARWVQVPGTRDLLFFSNYGGSWESYLEDFITKANIGLTAVWSNTEGFPKTNNLVLGGATDAERFKRWARRQQVPTAFWYSAYPELTTGIIRNNAVVRQGLLTAWTEAQAREWLSLFGSQPRPASTLQADEMQSLLFGGLGFLRHGLSLGFRLSDDGDAAKGWLADLLAGADGAPRVTFGDGRKHERATVLALAGSALPKLGMPAESVASFPPAFLDGMTAPRRSRILGDSGDDAPESWWWGGPLQEPDGLLLLYAKNEAELDRLRTRVEADLERRGHQVLTATRFRDLPPADACVHDKRRGKCEPFGFVDGVSQPLIRGTYKALRTPDPIHTVEPGEFVLGYPDNRGQVPPGPTLAPQHDRGGLLPPVVGREGEPTTPASPRDLGRNGSFLAVRHLEQDVRAFEDYCERAALEIAPRLSHPVDADWVAAKMVGRWKDGSSLTRNPYRPASDGGGHGQSRAAQAAGAVRTEGAIPPAAAAQASAPPPCGHSEPAPIEPDNDFLLGEEDAQGLRCPYGAHMRRANPRDSFEPGSQQQIAIANRHRIIRVGRFYEPQAGQKQGLFFMALNGDLERQFEFIQQTWMENRFFHALTDERDVFVGHGEGDRVFTIPTRDGPVRLKGLPSFVRTRGGGYYFVPSKSTLRWLAQGQS